MYAAYFGLHEKPFNLTPDPAYIYLSPKHQGVLDHLAYAAQEREGFSVITGNVGTGKTTVCRAFLDRLGPEVSSALVLNPMLSEEELLLAIVQDFGMTPESDTMKGLIDQLNEFLLDNLAQNRRVILILDEAQNLAPEVLEHIRILSNLETDKDKLMQIILVGQAELRTKLERHDLRQLNQRVSVRFHLDPLNLTETQEYIEHRLSTAGASTELRFTRRAIQTVFKYSGGVPRRINLLCDRALLRAFVEQQWVVTARMVRIGLRSLDGEDAVMSPYKVLLGFFAYPKYAIAGAATAAALVAAILFFGYRGLTSIRPPSQPPALASRVNTKPAREFPREAFITGNEENIAAKEENPPTVIPLGAAPPDEGGEREAATADSAPLDQIEVKHDQTLKPGAAPDEAEPSSKPPLQTASLDNPLTPAPAPAEPKNTPQEKKARTVKTISPQSSILALSTPSQPVTESAAAAPGAVSDAAGPVARGGIPASDDVAASAAQLARRAFQPNRRFPFTVHFGSYVELENVRQVIGELERWNYIVYLTRVPSSSQGIYYRILVGRYTARSEAEEAVKRLSQQFPEDGPRVLPADQAGSF